ncbi:LytR/AlgR family response regulator transcription factor [Winogradskyella flava]|uniref:LytR/AlgR family response regulator transcription factor n=1 Tax=Winogradskyella flava TaxID=1884876 RepID=UPI00248FF99D|nr:LytTR family DNA-binding domain-containing protein [Winogradskyella flava]
MINYLIIDDEPIAHEIIEEYAENLEILSLQKNCYNVFEAIEYLNSNSVDLIFLDINMPKISGFEFLKSLKNPPKVIVTTAYNTYAVESYELDVVDYLLKPFSLNRFLKAINKLRSYIEKYNEGTNSVEQKTIFLKDGKSHHQIKIIDILYIEALGNYTKVYTPDKVIITLEKLSSYLEILPDIHFIQVHKSFIVSTAKIKQIANGKIIIEDHLIPIGQTYRKNITTFLNT